MADDTTMQTIRVFVEAPSGQRFEADVPQDVPLQQIAADFFAEQGWPTQDSGGRGSRAVVELANPDRPDETKRLNGEQTLANAGIRDGDLLRVFPESIAGALTADANARLKALIQDQNDMQALAKRNRRIRFEANRDKASDQYDLIFDYPSFIELPAGTDEPRIGDTHEVRIVLDQGYPLVAPIVRWQTPIFHPNIHRETGDVCLGVLKERYLPGLGLARLVRMLAEMLQWRNADAFNAFNRTAAEWAMDTRHWDQIRAIGGQPIQGPIAHLFAEMENQRRKRIEFRAAVQD